MAPIVAWLASDQSDAANGRIFGASGHRISLFSEPVLERYLHFDEPRIDVDKLFELWPQTLGAGGYPRNSIRPGLV